MKILLIVPPYRTTDRLLPQLFPMPLGLLYIGTILEQNGHKVEIKDFLIPQQEHKTERPQSFIGKHNPAYIHFGWPMDKVLKWLNENKSRFDVVGIYSGQCAVYECVPEIVQYLKFLKMPIVVGGPFASTASEELIEKCHPNVIVRGEGEGVANHAFTLAVDGATDKIVEGGVVDFASLPIPNYSLINLGDYPRYTKKIRGVLTATRGCPWTCSFCSVHTIMGRKYRKVPIEKLRENLLSLVNTGAKYICFLDDNLFLLDDYGDAVLGLLEELRQKDKRFAGVTYHLEEGLEIRTAARPGFVSRMKKAGFDRIKIGLETMNEKTLKEFKKPYDRSMLTAAVDEFKAAGIRPMAFYIIGFPNDTIGSVLENIRELSKFGMEIRANNLKLYPGTDTTKDFLGCGWIDKNFDWRLSSFYTPTSSGMTYNEIKKLKGVLRATCCINVNLFDATQEEIRLALLPKVLMVTKDEIKLEGNFYRSGSWRRLVEILVIRFLRSNGAITKIDGGMIVGIPTKTPQNTVQEAIIKMYRIPLKGFF